VGAGSAVSLVAAVIQQVFSGYYPSLALPTKALRILWYFILPFLVWGFYSVFLFVFARAFSGKGSLLATLQNAGYGLFPWMISTIVDLVVPVVLFREPRIVYTSLWEFPPFVRGVIYLFFMGWTCILWVYAIKYTHSISQRRAIGSVLLLVVVSLLAIYAKGLCGNSLPPGISRMNLSG
jgi:hypothetical protein